MIERRHVVQKVVELMDQIGDMQRTAVSGYLPDHLTYELIQQAIFSKAMVMDHLMWVLELNDPKLPGAALVREEWAAIQAQERGGY